MELLERAYSAKGLDTSLTPFPRLFEQQVLRTPQAIAVEFEGQRATYAELNARSNQLAHTLMANSFAKETRVGICLDRSMDAIACMLGILKAGLAFVPLDPEFPQDRLAYIVDHAGIKLIWVDEQYRRLFSNSTARLESPTQTVVNASSQNPDLELSSSDLAYVMYTSGSTGKPKGVQIEHGSLTTYCLADVETYKICSTDRTLQFSTLNFDIAIEEIYPPLLVGSTVVVRPRERSDAAIELSHLIEQYSISALHIATAYWNEWVNLMASSQARVPKSLRLVIVTGEKISVELYRRWKTLCDHDLLWCNAYGPTETTVTCTAFIPEPDWDNPQMPIGRPLPGYSAYILDDQLRPVESQQTGQLFIGGPALARGYLDRPDLTSKAFLDVQFENELEPQRIYRTGDLARWLPNGEIEFSGRVDHQMKIGSYRIEPGEIEAVLNLHDAVLESLMVCEEHAGQKYLIAHVVLAPGRECSPIELAKFLRQHLPAYMVPSRYSFLASMPKTINGKIDREALPKGDQLQTSSHTGDAVEPTTELERELVEIWKEVLQLPRIGIHDDFFHLGGSSLLVTRVIAQMSRQAKVAVPVRDFFANPTIALLASHLEFVNETMETTAARSERTRRTIRERLPKIQSLELRHSVRLATIHYPAIDPARRKNHVLVIAQPYGHEYTRAHRNAQQLSVQLAQQGFDVVRFDYAGTGDSEGDASLINVPQWTDDIQAVCRAALELPYIDSLSVLGIRLGANLLARCELPDVQYWIAWDPILDPSAFLKQLQAMHEGELKSLTRYLSIRSSSDDNLLGYPWPKSFQAQLLRLRWRQDQQYVRAKHRWWLASQPNSVGQEWFMKQRSKSEPVLNPCDQVGWKFEQLSDQILWEHPSFTNSAFASRAFDQRVQELLTPAEQV